MKRALITFVVFIFSFTVFASSSNSVYVNDKTVLSWLTKKTVFVSSTEVGEIEVSNPFSRGFDFFLKVIIGVGGGVSVLLLTAYDFINAYRINDEDPNSYSKALLKVLIKIILVFAVCSLGYAIVNNGSF